MEESHDGIRGAFNFLDWHVMKNGRLWVGGSLFVRCYFRKTRMRFCVEINAVSDSKRVSVSTLFRMIPLFFLRCPFAHSLKTSLVDTNNNLCYHV